MPDYNKTVIYKIQHLEDATLLYIGSTTNFIKRKAHHVYSYKKVDGRKYNLKVYQTIRENGGWGCFDMIEIKTFPCETKRQAECEEERIMREMKATMNGQKAVITEQEKLDYIKEYRTKNADELKVQKKAYYESNREVIAQKQKVRVQERHSYQKQYRDDNKEQLTEKGKQYRDDNKEKIAACKKQYRDNNKEKVKEQNRQSYLRCKLKQQEGQ